MEILGLSITRAQRTKAAVAPIRHWDVGWRTIYEPFAGAWQRNIDKSPKNILAHSALYAGVTLIASDIGKLRLKLVEQDTSGVWEEIKAPAFSPVLRKPNRYQTRQKFLEQWVISKLIDGNAYILKQRDQRQVVEAMYVLDPKRATPLVAPDGSVFYQLRTDNLAGIEETSITVPASEIIHDVMVPLYHPLCGVSPITACALPAAHGLSTQEFAARFFANNAQPGGMLTAPGEIDNPTAERLKKQFEENYGGENVGRIAVAGSGLKYESMSINAVDAQLIEQLKWTGEQIATCLHIPPYLLGIGGPPPYTNVQALNLQYYSQCLQGLIESIELLLDDGLGLEPTRGIEFDLDGLLRMDTATAMEVATKAVTGAVYSPDEARRKFDLKPVKGGNTPYLQQQNFSLAALAERDANDPFAKPEPAPTTTALPAPDPEEDDEPMDERSMMALFRKGAEYREAA